MAEDKRQEESTVAGSQQPAGPEAGAAGGGGNAPPPRGGSRAAKSGGDPPSPSALGKRASKWSPYVAGFIGLAFAGAVLYSFSRIDARSMADPEYARGVITLLITVAFIVLGVLLIITALFPFSDETSNDASFRRAREVFNTIVGIVGTIVGFYFGTTTDRDTRLDVAWKVDGTRLILSLSGGRKPFSAAVTSGSETINQTSEQNLFVIDVCTLKGARSEANTAEVSDSTKASKKVTLGRLLTDQAVCPGQPSGKPAAPAGKAPEAPPGKAAEAPTK
jgi:hypothetical protein